MVPVRLVHFSYLVASSYVLCHGIFHASLARACKQPEKSQQHGEACSVPFDSDQTLSAYTNIIKTVRPSPVKALMDTLVWQALASVIIPGLVVNRTCFLSKVLLNVLFRKRLSKQVTNYTVTGIGIGVIPLIIQPIDRCSCCLFVVEFTFSFNTNIIVLFITCHGMAWASVMNSNGKFHSGESTAPTNRPPKDCE